MPPFNGGGRISSLPAESMTYGIVTAFQNSGYSFMPGHGGIADAVVVRT